LSATSTGVGRRHLLDCEPATVIARLGPHPWNTVAGRDRSAFYLILSQPVRRRRAGPEKFQSFDELLSHETTQLLWFPMLFSRFRMLLLGCHEPFTAMAHHVICLCLSYLFSSTGEA
jgi:hypothetical protein